MFRFVLGFSTLVILTPVLASQDETRCARRADAPSTAACARVGSGTRLAQNTLAKAPNEDPIIPAALPQPPTPIELDEPPKPPEPGAAPRPKKKDVAQKRPGEQKKADERPPARAHATQRIALDPGVLKSEPAPHSMHRNQVVLVDDGSCQNGMIKRVAVTRFGRHSYCAPPR